MNGKQDGPCFVSLGSEKSWNKQVFFKREEIRGEAKGKGRSRAGFTQITQHCRKNQGSNLNSQAGTGSRGLSTQRGRNTRVSLSTLL